MSHDSTLPPEEFVKIRRMDAPEKLGYTTKHFNDEAKEHKWHREQIGKAVFYHVPMDYYLERQKLKELTSRVVRKPDTNFSEGDKQLAKVLEEVIERQVKLEEQIAVNNREIEARNTALVKYKEQERSIETLTKQIETLQITIREQAETLQEREKTLEVRLQEQAETLQTQIKELQEQAAKQKPWWQFWG